MNTVIAHNQRSNDSDAMSPALTQDHSQNVADTNDFDASSTLVSKLKNSVSDKSVKFGGKTENGYSNGGGTLDIAQYERPASKSVEPSEVGQLKYHSQQPINNVNESINMTPRIILPTISSADEQLPNEPDYSRNTDETHFTTGGFNEAHGSKIAAAEKVTENVISATCNTASHIPTVAELSDDSMSIERRVSCVIKRIRHMQSILANRHSRQQLMKFVEQQSENQAGVATSENKVPSVNSHNHYHDSVSGSNTEKLHNMSSSTLVDLVQRMRTGNTVNRINDHVGDRKKPKMNLTTDAKLYVRKAVGITSTTVRQIRDDIDSDATESSSGCETDDEFINSIAQPHLTNHQTDSHGEPSQVHTSGIKKKGCWRWTRDRAMIVSRWTWLQAQVSDLEYRIRQHGEIHKQLRAAKAPTAPLSLSNRLLSENDTERAARCMPIQLSTSRGKRHRLVHVSNAPKLSQKARRPISIRCQCMRSLRRCAICAGHHDYTKPQDIQLLTFPEKVGQLDPTFHPVLSFGRDINSGIELEEVINASDKRHSTSSRPILDKKLIKLNKKMLAETLKKKKLALKLKKATEKENRKKRKAMSTDRSLENLPSNKVKKKKLDSKIKGKKKLVGHRVRANSIGHRVRTKSVQNLSDDDEEELMEEEYAENSLTQSAPTGELSKSTSASINKRSQSYDIDDIVIPYHIASTTRVEKLQYKEIDTPRWRECDLNGSTVHEQLRRRSSSMSAPVTPMTPALAESRLPGAQVPETSTDVEPVDQADGETNTVAADTAGSDPASLSAPRSCTTSPQSSEVEDLSDHRYIARHNVCETKEKARYMNFVTSNRRTRMHSSTASGYKSNVMPSPLSPGVPVETSRQSIGSDAGNDIQNSNSRTTSIPLSSSHDAVQMKDELSATDRKRSSSFTANRPKRDSSLYITDKPDVSPWARRCFPLKDDDMKELECKPKAPSSSSWDNMSTEEWKVITTEDVSHNDKNPLVLKLSKT